MQTATLILGAVIVVVALAAFFRSLWRSPSRRGGGNSFDSLGGGVNYDNTAITPIVAATEVEMAAVATSCFRSSRS